MRDKNIIIGMKVREATLTTTDHLNSFPHLHLFLVAATHVSLSVSYAIADVKSSINCNIEIPASRC